MSTIEFITALFYEPAVLVSCKLLNSYRTIQTIGASFWACHRPTVSPAKNSLVDFILPIRSIDFYYPEFQAANALIVRDKSKICFLEGLK
jgi:hypothetical protein